MVIKRGIDMAYSERELLARIIKCEAGGEGDNGMKAVATIIMNRVNASGGEYLKKDQGDLRKVIFQKDQFTCAMVEVYGQPNMQNLWSSEPDQLHYSIADWALSGNKLSSIGEALWYFNPYNPVCPDYFPVNKNGSFVNKIGQHCFYLPTPKYYTT